MRPGPFRFDPTRAGAKSLDSPGLGEPLVNALAAAGADDRLDLGCVAAHGIFSYDEEGCGTLTPMGKAATAFLLELIARLQEKATVPMIELRAYARWLDVDVLP